VAGLVAASAWRRAFILNRDLLTLRLGFIHYLPFAALLAVAWFTPAVLGALFWAGAAVAAAAGVLYVATLAAFVRAGPGLNTRGVYRWSRNPMYVAASAAFAGFTLMAWGASARMGLLALIVTLALLVTDHAVVEREEAFLEERYGDAYRAYKARVPRYFGFF